MDHTDPSDLDEVTAKFCRDFAERAPKHWATALAEQDRLVCSVTRQGEAAYEAVCNTTGVSYDFTLEGDSAAVRRQIRDAANQLMVLAILSTR